MEGHLSTVCALILVLVAIGLSDASHRVKSGACPRSGWAADLKCSLRVKNECQDDYDCLGIYKCCYQGCRRVCLPPKEVKPGVCPNLHRDDVINFSHIKHECYDDYDCDGNHKCCYKGFVRVCVSPKRVKPGQCPSLAWFGNAKCFHPRHECSDDYDCNGQHKCCYNGCARVCVSPAKGEVKPGQCPSSAWFGKIKCFHPRHECSDDHDCNGQHKCCYNGCARVCVSPAKGQVKPGQCPSSAWFGKIKCFHPRHECSDDYDCNGNHKCCYNGCGRVCVAPQKAFSSGVCPNFPRRNCLRFGRNRCSKDSHCPAHKRCCMIGCRRVCVPLFFRRG